MIPILMIASGCAVKTPGPASPGAPQPALPGGAKTTNTYNIGGYQVNKRFFWVGMSAATILGGVFIDNVPDSSTNGELDVMDFVPVGLYTLGGGFLIGAF